MNLDTTMAGVYTDLQGFGDMKIAARNNTPEAVRAVAKQFEALFVQTMLKSMRDASVGSGLFESSQTRTYQDLYDKQISLDLSARGDFGFSEMLVRQLGDHSEEKPAARMPSDGFPFHPEKDGRVFNDSVRSPVEILQKVRAGLFNHSPGMTAKPESLQQSNSTVNNAPTESVDQFIQRMYPHAKQAAEKLGVQPEVLLAQAALETGWGRHMIQHPDGRNSFNLFGIKASHDWQGERVAVSSLEYNQGVARKQLSAFRAYDSYASSFADYAELIGSRPRYQGAINNAADPEAYLRSLQDAGYATDPRYADKILGILKRNDLIPAPAQQVMLRDVSAKLDEG